MTMKDKPIMTIDEVHEIIYLLRGKAGTNEGDFRNKHLGVTLDYLRRTGTEDKSITCQKLSLMLGMASRQVKENYIDGLIAWGIISLDTLCRTWKWIGVSALKDKFGQIPKRNELEESETPFTDWAKRDKKEKEEDKKE